MKWLDLIHRWVGGLIGLVLALLGLSGAVLIHKDDWVRLPHAADPRIGNPDAIANATQRLLGDGQGAGGIIYASDRFGLHQLRSPDGSGAYADQTGEVVTRWASQWDRVEFWLFDFHHHLFTGDAGEVVAGIAGIAAIAFVVTGAILWWRTRRTFALRLLPKRLTRPAIVMHHRDLGIVAAPLLLLSAVTGTMMIFPWFAAIVVAPFTPPAQVRAAISAPKLVSAPLAARPDWRAMIVAAHGRFPDAQIRILTLPRRPGDPIAIRMKRAAEWLPNGRSTLWFDAGSGRLLAVRDALAMPRGAQVFNAAYPLHAAKVGGLPYRLVMTLSGLAMALLGSFTVWSFWFKRPRVQSRTAANARRTAPARL